jgi:hypothetical protein
MSPDLSKSKQKSESKNKNTKKNGAIFEHHEKSCRSRDCSVNWYFRPWNLRFNLSSLVIPVMPLGLLAPYSGMAQTKC